MSWKHLIARVFKALPTCLDYDAFDVHEIDFDELEACQQEAEKLEHKDRNLIEEFKKALETVGHGTVRAGLLEQAEAGNLVFAWEMLWRWDHADFESKLDIASFFESDGPELIRQAKLKHEEDVPTSSDLDRLVGCPKCDGVGCEFCKHRR